jgi:hypothetical protein
MRSTPPQFFYIYTAAVMFHKKEGERERKRERERDDLIDAPFCKLHAVGTHSGLRPNEQKKK